MKVNNKGKQLTVVAAAVTAFNVALTGLSYIITHPTGKHLEVARQMSAGPEEADFMRLMGSAEANWTIYSGMAMVIVQFVLYVAAIYLAYKYIRQRRLTSNPGGITTAIFAVASTVALLVSTWINGVLGLQMALYESPSALIGLSIINLIVSFLVTFVIVLLVEKRYDRKHSFAIE